MQPKGYEICPESSCDRPVAGRRSDRPWHFELLDRSVSRWNQRLGACILRKMVDRNGIPADDYDDVVFGTIDAVGPLAGNIARTCWLAAGLPMTVPGVTIDRQCGSSQQAVHFAAQAVMSGTQDVVVAAGVENMSTVPIGASITLAIQAGQPHPFGQGWLERYGKQEISQFRGSQLMCERWGLKRPDLEEFALASHERAIAAIDSGRF